jgi:hypothetical protein
LYWPFDDLVDHSAGLMEQYGVHENKWLTESAAGRLSAKLLQAGFTFDFVSDAQLQRVSVNKGALVAPGGRYRVIVVPAARRMPVETLERLRDLAKRGARVMFESLPQDVPGFGKLESRRAALQKLLEDPLLRAASVGEQLEHTLAATIPREQAAAVGLAHIRRASAEGHDYFFANLGANAFDGWLQLGVAASSAKILDPLTGRSGGAAVRRGKEGGAQVYLQLASGQSVLVRTSRSKSARASPPWFYVKPAADGIALRGEWSLEFIKGGPVLPKAARLSTLASWTSLDDPEASRFAGTARYRLEFDAPAQHADAWDLDLGDVRETARVKLNGKQLATAWSLPFKVRIDSLQPRGNVLEIEVTNLAANRIRDLDARKVPWKNMRDVNIVSVKYRPFDAAAWEVEPAGLLGPVLLAPLSVVQP